MRPVYEKEADRQKQELVAALVFDITCWSYSMSQPFDPYDAVLSDSKGARALLEIKVRNKVYSDYMISQRKVNDIIRIARERSLVPLLAVAWEPDHRLGLVDLSSCRKKAGTGGRKDRGDDQDIEDVFLIPITEFSMWRVESWPWQSAE